MKQRGIENENKIALCWETALGEIKNKTLRTRMDCLHFVMGYLGNANIKSIPIKMIEDID